MMCPKINIPEDTPIFYQSRLKYLERRVCEIMITADLLLTVGDLIESGILLNMSSTQNVPIV